MSEKDDQVERHRKWLKRFAWVLRCLGFVFSLLKLGDRLFGGGSDNGLDDESTSGGE